MKFINRPIEVEEQSYNSLNICKQVKRENFWRKSLNKQLSFSIRALEIKRCSLNKKKTLKFAWKCIKDGEMMHKNLNLERIFA